MLCPAAALCIGGNHIATELGEYETGLDSELEAPEIHEAHELDLVAFPTSRAL
jgi:hypothetical protein